jgi:hypothetical protein
MIINITNHKTKAAKRPLLWLIMESPESGLFLLFVDQLFSTFHELE